MIERVDREESAAAQQQQQPSPSTKPPEWITAKTFRARISSTSSTTSVTSSQPAHDDSDQETFLVRGVSARAETAISLRAEGGV